MLNADEQPQQLKLLDKDNAAAGHLNFTTTYIPPEGSAMAKEAASKPKVKIEKKQPKKKEDFNIKILDAEFVKDLDQDALIGKSK